MEFYKNEIPDVELKKLERHKKLVVYDDETGKILTDAEINELDELRNASLYPNTIIVEEDIKDTIEREIVVVKKNKRGRKLRIPIPAALRKEILEANNYQCSVCGYISKHNQLHHMDENPHNNNKDNLTIFCYECHKTVHKKEV